MLTFGEALEFAKKGEAIARKGWNGKHLFVFMQIPATIDLKIVPTMQSLPQQIKSIFIKRNELCGLNHISYSNQMAIVDSKNEIKGWSPSVSDTLATDWYILT